MNEGLQTLLQGVAHVYGDHIDTDRIIPGKYTKTLDLAQLSAHVLEDLDPDFRDRMRQGDMVIGGENFGCGSSREQAPLALKHAGVSAVIARSFARIFYRNATNIGLPLLELSTLGEGFIIHSGDTLSIDLSLGRVRNLTKDQECLARPLPPVMRAILEAGGLTPFIAQHGGWGALLERPVSGSTIDYQSSAKEKEQ